MGKTVRIDTELLGINWQPSANYRIAIDEGFVKEDGNNQSPNPANTSLTTFTTNGNDMVVDTSTPAQNENNNIENATITLGFDRRIKAGNGSLYLYKVVSGGSDQLIKTWDASDSGGEVTMIDQTMTLDMTGLQLEGESYYLLGDVGSVTDRDGFDWVGFTQTTDLPWTNSTGPEFPGLAADLSGAFLPAMSVNAQRIGEGELLSEFTMTANVGAIRRPSADMTARFTIPVIPVLIDTTLTFNGVFSSTIDAGIIYFNTVSMNSSSSMITFEGHPWAAIKVVGTYEFDSDVASGSYSNNTYTYQLFSDSRSNQLGNNNLNYDNSDPTNIFNRYKYNFSNGTTFVKQYQYLGATTNTNYYTKDGTTMTLPYQSSALSYSSLGGTSNYHPRLVSSATINNVYDGGYTIVGMTNDNKDVTRFNADANAGTLSGWYDWTRRIFGAVYSGTTYRCLLVGPDQNATIYNGGTYTRTLSTYNQGGSVAQTNIDFCLDANLPNGGIAVVADGGKINVYTGFTGTNPQLQTTLTCSNFIDKSNSTYANNDYQNYFAGVRVNSEYIIAENWGRTPPGSNSSGTYKIDLFDINNNYARTTIIEETTFNAPHNTTIYFEEQCGISADSQYYIPFGQRRVNTSDILIKYKDMNA